MEQTDTQKSAASSRAAVPDLALTVPDMSAAVESDQAAVAPDSASDLVPIQQWPARSYESIVTGPGATKLASSRIAPLVALARGYRHVEEHQAKEVGKQVGLTSMTTSKAKSLTKALSGAGAMLMPRFIPGTCRSRPTGAIPTISRGEFKPVYPDTDPTSGKVRKYVTLYQDSPVLDVHPATPPEWLDHTAIALITEGVLKGDAGLTALLLRHGQSYQSLDIDPDAVPERGAAIDLLQAMLRQIPDYAQTLIISFGGVGSWHANPEWAEMNLKGRRIWVAFDGDVATNANVWSQANQLWRRLENKKAIPLLLNLNVACDVGGGVIEHRKLGLDDYLGTVGPWSSLTSLVVQALPAAPAAKGDPVRGEWRIDNDSGTCDEFQVTEDANGIPHPAWKTHVRIGGRIASITEVRNAQDLDIETGVASSDPTSCTAAIEVFWKDETSGQMIYRIVTGPDAILAEAPSEWHKGRIGARIPSELMSHPEWPADIKWLAAVKGNRRADIDQSTRWGHMGWVPSTQGSPVFISGGQVIGADGFMPGAATPGITKAELDRSERYGVIEPADDHELRAAITAVFDAYERTWTNKRYASVVLAAALRSVVPLPSHTPIACTGSSGKGKSHLASCFMAFHQRKPGLWGNGFLPGSVTDTPASTEHAISCTHVWVVDDLAPSGSQRAMEEDVRKVEAIIRSIFNRAGKRRMTQDMKAREVSAPRAMTILTGENMVPTASAANRVFNLPFAEGEIMNIAAVDAIRDETGQAAMVTFAAIKMIAGSRPYPGGWLENIEAWKATYANLQLEALDYFKDDGAHKRQAEMCADLALGLEVWKHLAVELGMTEIQNKILGMAEDIYSLMEHQLQDKAATSPGQSVLAAIRNVLAAGRAHIQSIESPAAPPFLGGDGHVKSTRLGWLPSGDAQMLRPGGTRIGHVTTKNGRDIVLLDQTNSFQVAMKAHPELLPFGSSQSSAWNATWAEGLTCPDGNPWRRPRTKGRPRPVVRAMVNGIQFEGVPFFLEDLLTATHHDDPEEES